MGIGDAKLTACQCLLAFESVLFYTLLIDLLHSLYEQLELLLKVREPQALKHHTQCKKIS
jgi:hypothetical protein